MKETHTNKLSIYLIKSEYNTDKDILKKFDELKKKN